MDEGRFERVAPLAGAAFTVLFLIALLTGGETPSTKASGETVISHYRDSGKTVLAVLVVLIGGVLFVFFAGALREALRTKGREWLSTVAFGGALLYAGGLAVMGMTQIALTDAADLGQPQVAQALNILDNDNFLPTVLGLAVVLLATGWHVLGSGVLPRWLGIVAVVLGVLAVAGPAGILAFLLFPLWVLATSILLYRRPAVGAGPA